MNEQKLMLKRRLYNYALKAMMLSAIGLITLLVFFLVLYILVKGLPMITFDFLCTKPSRLKGTIGILPDILNTLYVVIATLAIVLPLGVGAAVYLTEYARNQRFVQVIEYAAETLAGIPSIIYGLVGMIFFCEFFRLKTSLLAGSLTLVIMNLPTVMRTTQESLKAVPQSYREGALALGAMKWQMIKTVVLPNCGEGIITGSILSLGRIMGETAALFYTAGFAHALNGFFTGLFNAGATLTVSLYVYAKESGEFEAAFAIAAILVILTLLLNLAADIVKITAQRRKR